MLSKEKERPSATIWFETGHPVWVPMLSRVLNAVNRDYRQAFRRDLAVAAMERASSGIQLEDLGALTDQIDDLFNFMDNLRLFFGLAVPNSTNIGTRRQQMNINVHDSAKALAKAALKTGAPVRITSRSAAGCMLNIHLNGPHARKMLAIHKGIGRTSAVPTDLKYLEERISAVFNDFTHIETQRSPASRGVFDPHGPMALVLSVFIERVVAHKGGIQRIFHFAEYVHELGHVDTAFWIEQTARQLAQQHR